MICKKGMLMGNILSLIIAFAALIVLLMFGLSFFNVTVADSEAEAAQTFIDSALAKVESVEEGESGEFSLTGVEGWFFTAWDGEGKTRPDKCSFGSCICICNGDSFGEGHKAGGIRGGYQLDYRFIEGTEDEAVKSACQERGFCRAVEGYVLPFAHTNTYCVPSTNCKNEYPIYSFDKDGKLIQLGVNRESPPESSMYWEGAGGYSLVEDPLYFVFNGIDPYK
jgi:hypothetical protein